MSAPAEVHGLMIGLLTLIDENDQQAARQLLVDLPHGALVDLSMMLLGSLMAAMDDTATVLGTTRREWIQHLALNGQTHA